MKRPTQTSSRSGQLSVPWALDTNGQLVTPAEVSSSEGLRCPNPACGSRLALRAGSIRVRHFAHLDEGRCSLESVEHWAAKYLLAKVVLASLSEPNRRPVIHRRCPECGKVVLQPLPESVQDARVEGAVEGFRVDVLLLDGAQRPLCAVEVLHTHAVTVEKGEGLSIPWIELAAADVLASPLRWVPHKEGLKPFRCDHAGTEYLRRKEREETRKREAAEEAARRGREAAEQEAKRVEMIRIRAGWCPFPLARGEYFADITGPAYRWWPMNAWRSESMQQAIAVLESRLRDSREFRSYFHPRSTVIVSIRAWDGTLVDGEWRDGKWIRHPANGAVRERNPRTVLIVRSTHVPPIRRRRRL